MATRRKGGNEHQPAKAKVPSKDLAKRKEDRLAEVLSLVAEFFPPRTLSRSRLVSRAWSDILERQRCANWHLRLPLVSDKAGLNALLRRILRRVSVPLTSGFVVHRSAVANGQVNWLYRRLLLTYTGSILCCLALPLATFALFRFPKITTVSFYFSLYAFALPLAGVCAMATVFSALAFGRGSVPFRFRTAADRLAASVYWYREVCLLHAALLWWPFFAPVSDWYPHFRAAWKDFRVLEPLAFSLVYLFVFLLSHVIGMYVGGAVQLFQPDAENLPNLIGGGAVATFFLATQFI
eukprot:TRINITY_DN22614_c0_g2_i1.p1 TRINITY_DN22614_c0_g2~~TRINITY_DN22614_c0_g2_i1.p1  ORF type:complete len:302 (+),score=34.26 TRINITY_DN22614_c0_g2_i1:26-907(+)